MINRVCRSSQRADKLFRLLYSSAVQRWLWPSDGSLTFKVNYAKYNIILQKQKLNNQAFFITKDDLMLPEGLDGSNCSGRKKNNRATILEVNYCFFFLSNCNYWVNVLCLPFVHFGKGRLNKWYDSIGPKQRTKKMKKRTA